MKALIPSHKEEKRYLKLKGKNLRKETIKAIRDYVGLLGLSEASPRWVSDDILSINRKYLEKVRAAISLAKEKIEILKVSGTLKKLRS